QNPINNDLCYIVRYVEALRMEAWQKLLSQNPINNDLLYIIEYVEALRSEAKGFLNRTSREIMEDIKNL
ncbi:MAG: hypothetical protein KKA60_16395, partial [Proteobacteria bacterium]|nr:hypothetical protein [Pseudomonadota bacterium]